MGVILVIGFFMFFIALIIVNYLESCKHDWEDIKSLTYEIENARDHHVGWLYVYEYQCTKCKHHKIEQHKVKV